MYCLTRGHNESDGRSYRWREVRYPGTFFSVFYVRLFAGRCDVGCLDRLVLPSFDDRDCTHAQIAPVRAGTCIPVEPYPPVSTGVDRHGPTFGSDRYTVERTVRGEGGDYTRKPVCNLHKSTKTHTKFIWIQYGYRSWTYRLIVSVHQTRSNTARQLFASNRNTGDGVSHSPKTRLETGAKPLKPNIHLGSEWGVWLAVRLVAHSSTAREAENKSQKTLICPAPIRQGPPRRGHQPTATFNMVSTTGSRASTGPGRGIRQTT